ncbi:MAG: peptidoglycan editing factor PgeF [Actinobacteria bacterium]|nr:peptidoglycan editing factor PgeF [Actinomycetota bacterium]
MKKLKRPWTLTKVIAGTTIKGIENLKSLLSLLNIDGNYVLAAQVHGNKISIVSAKDKLKIKVNTDGLITNNKDLYLVIRTADCLPVFFYDPIKEIAGICHAGWKGTYLDISGNMIKLFKSLGSNIKNIKVHIGPHIKTYCYEIKQDVVAKFNMKYFHKDVILRNNGRIFLNLAKANSINLQSQGILRNNITISKDCTYCNKDEFYSYRRLRNNEKLYEMYSLIALT